MPAEIEYAHTLDLELPKYLLDQAKRQGEDPDKMLSLVQEFKDMIFGKFK